MTVHIVAEKYESDTIASQFNVLFVTVNLDKAKELFEKTVLEDPRGFLKENGIYTRCEDYIESNYVEGSVSYQIISREVLDI